MKKIYIISLLLSVVCLSVYAASEAEYGKLAKTYTLNADGSQEFRYNMELTLFTHTAMNRTYGESFIIYNPKFQELKIHTSYTRQKDGTIIQTPENAFVEVLPRQAANAPAFNHLKEMVVVHTGFELGATIYLDYSIISKPGYLPELDIRDAIAQTSPVKDYTITVQVPENKPLFYALSNLNVKPSVNNTNGIKQIRWKIRNLPAASRAPQVTALAGDAALLTVSSYASNTEALKVLNKQLTPSGNMPALSLAETVTEGKISDTEKLYAILNHVIDNLGNSPLSLAETGYKIRSIDNVNPSAYGTEAEKVNLLASLLNAMNIKAEVIAAYLNKADINTCGLNAIDELFVAAKADGKQYLLTPKKKSMSDAGWYTHTGQLASISNPGQAVAIEIPSANLDYIYSITLSPEKAEIQSNATIGNAFVPYNEKGKKDITGKTEQPLELFNNKIALLSLPEPPNSLSNASYKNYNTKREENLLLPYKAKENFTYTIQLPADMELNSPETVKTVDNTVGKTVYSVRQDGNLVEVKRTLEMKKQLISPADYPAFRQLITEWTDINKCQLLFKLN
ncbi:MAG: DUF3857 domain-containing protein [Tannerellaceae bacterium]|nr:DUF3857 domain-containing protein [Tannerellaceae bacterium]